MAAETHPRSAEGVAYQVVKAMVDSVISDPDHASDPRTHLRGGLHPVRRLWGGPKSRFRIFYLVSDAKRTAILLWLGYRREGDVGDAYAELAKMLAAGDFDDQFAELEPASAGADPEAVARDAVARIVAYAATSLRRSRTRRAGASSTTPTRGAKGLPSARS